MWDYVELHRTKCGTTRLIICDTICRTVCEIIYGTIWIIICDYYLEKTGNLAKSQKFLSCTDESEWKPYTMKT